MGGNYEKSIYNQLMDVMVCLDFSVGLCYCFMYQESKETP